MMKTDSKLDITEFWATRNDSDEEYQFFALFQHTLDKDEAGEFFETPKLECVHVEGPGVTFFLTRDVIEPAAVKQIEEIQLEAQRSLWSSADVISSY